MGSFLSDTFFTPLKYCKYVYFKIQDLNMETAEFLKLSAESACWEIEII
jgi:hypothetical protein